MKRARVLLADDHADVADQLRSILEAEFDVVATVENGIALLSAVCLFEPDVIVTDVAMPGMDGLEATTRILQRIPKARVVLVTLYDEAGIQRRAFATGALGYVSKLSADQDLLPAVRAACRGEHFVASPHSTGLE
jgi:DNA-binding NarL/FixJ family response regulator